MSSHTVCLCKSSKRKTAWAINTWRRTHNSMAGLWHYYYYYYYAWILFRCR